MKSTWMTLALFSSLCLPACGNTTGGRDAGDLSTRADATARETRQEMSVADNRATDRAEDETTSLTTPGGLPLALPFELTRNADGDPLTDAEIAEFTGQLTGFWKQIDYFNWVYETCHGMDASTGYPDYLIWWHDVDAVKEGNKVTFRNSSKYGGSHNNADPTSTVLTQAVTGYLMTGDPAMGRIVEQFAKSFTAMMKGFVYDENDTVETVMARNIITHNHEFTLPSGKLKAVDYTEWYNTYEGWNADRIHYPNNPYWGDIYVTTMRSKDDVPIMYRSTGWFPYLIELAPDDSVKAAVEEAYEYMQGFARDVVDHGYYIRSKDADGKAFIPNADLASFNDYVDLIPDAECDARLSTALLAYADPLDNDCGSGQGSPYDAIAGGINYFNYAIIDRFHLSALHFALTTGHNDVALELLKGVITRLERYQDPNSDEEGKSEPDWERDIALRLLQAASLGMPLTANEARLVHKYHRQAVERYEQFPNWDLWDPSVPDGAYDFREGFHPKHGPDAVRIEDIAFVLEYCWSPFKNPAGARFVDCDIVADPGRWGE